MYNLNGPYPGRAVLIGRTKDGRPAFAYLVTGRSPPSRARVAMPVETGIIIGPSDDAPYDPLRHYTSVKVDDEKELAVVTNGIQTGAIFEAYKLIADVEDYPTEKCLKAILSSAGPEPDTLHTPRIAGVITRGEVLEETEPKYLLGITVNSDSRQSAVWNPVLEPLGTLMGVSTYKGDMNNPEPFIPGQAKYLYITFDGKNPKDLASQLFEQSEAKHDGKDIRVCALGGIYYHGLGKDNGSWKMAIVQPGSSAKDKEVAEAAEKYGVELFWV